MTPEEKELINEKFDKIHNEIIAGNNLINQKLDTLNEKVQKQNGRVQKLEDYKEYAQGIIATRVTTEMVQSCHTKIEGLEKTFEDVKFLTKYPKLFISALVIVVILTLATFLETGSKFFDKVKIQEPVKTELVK